MTFAERIDGQIVVKTEYRDKDLIRATPGARYDVNDHRWHVPLSWGSCLTLRGLFRDRLEIGPALVEWATHHKSEFVDVAMRLRELTHGDVDPRLYPFQSAGVDFLVHTNHALLNDDMGTGKTVQTVYSLVESLRRRTENPFPGLVVCPNNMKTVWQKHFNDWWPSVECVVLDGGRTQRLKQIKQIADGKAHVLVANWEGLRGHSRLAPYGSIRLKRCVECDRSLRGDPEVEKKHKKQNCERCARELNEISWTTMIADEVHRAKDPKAKQTRALFALRTNATKIRYGLTGTPIADTPQDLWPALHFIDPEQWPTRGLYVDRYCLQTYDPFGGYHIIGLKPEMRDEFFAITDPHVRRMPKSLVLTQLPDKVHTTRYVDASPKQRKAYETMESDMIARIGTDEEFKRLVATNPLVQLTRLTQFASAYADLVETEYKDPDTGETKTKIDVRLAEPSNKVDALLEVLDELGTKPVVVFAQSRQLVELAAARLTKDKISHTLIVGGQHAVERQHSIDRFQNGEVRCALATVGAGGVGITLARADTAIFLQRSWSMIDNTQAEDRIHRIGSEKHESVTIVDIVTRGTVEEKQREVLEAKGDRLQEIVRDAELLDRVLGKNR